MRNYDFSFAKIKSVFTTIFCVFQLYIVNQYANESFYCCLHDRLFTNPPCMQKR